MAARVAHHFIIAPAPAESIGMGAGSSAAARPIIGGRYRRGIAWLVGEANRRAAIKREIVKRHRRCAPSSETQQKAGVGIRMYHRAAA